MSQKKTKGIPLNESLLAAMGSLDKQVARQLNSRTPQQTEAAGVQKWEAHSQRIESTTTLLLDALGDKEVQLDSLLILAQSFCKALSFVAADLGEEGLGAVRTQYCLEAFRNIARDCANAEGSLKDEQHVLN